MWAQWPTNICPWNLHWAWIFSRQHVRFYSLLWEVCIFKLHFEFQKKQEGGRSTIKFGVWGSMVLAQESNIWGKRVRMMNEEGDTGKTVPTHNIIRTYLHASLFSIPSQTSWGLTLAPRNRRKYIEKHFSYSIRSTIYFRLRKLIYRNPEVLILWPLIPIVFIIIAFPQLEGSV